MPAIKKFELIMDSFLIVIFQSLSVQKFIEPGLHFLINLRKILPRIIL